MSQAAPISVVVPCFRCSSTIERAIDSVAAQTIPPFEVILVDDASGDQTRSALEAISGRYKAGWIKLVLLNQNVGAASARNAGWAVATQPYIAFLDSDDSWHSEKLAIQYGYMRDNPNIALSGHQCALFKKATTEMKASSNWNVTNISARSLLFRNAFSTPTVMLKSEVALRFQEGQRCAEDVFLWQKLAFLGMKVIRIETPLAYVHKPLYGVSGLSAQLWKMEQGELSNFASLRESKTIGWPLFFIATSFSCIKFIRRIILTKIIGRKKHTGKGFFL